MCSFLFGRALALCLALALLGSGACARSAPSVVLRPKAPPPESGPARTAPTELEQATVYDTKPTRRGLRGDAADSAIAESLANVANSTGLIADGRLAELALGIAASTDRALHAPDFAQVTYHAHRAGIAEPTPQIWLASGANVTVLLPALERAIQDATRSSHLTHIGAAALYIDPTQREAGVLIALALSTRLLTLRAPVPRSIDVGSLVGLAGELAAGYSSPVLAVTSEAGMTRTPLGKTRRFRRDIAASQTGELTLELLATGPEGLTVVALMPVMVGVPVATEPPARVTRDSEEDAATVGRKLLALIAEERERRRLTPLRNDPRLAQAALAHSQDMLANDFIAHSSRRSGDATERVSAAGLEAVLVLENIGRGYSAMELHHGLMESPGHRANILNPEARELGIGVVLQPEGDRHAFLVTELFTQLSAHKP